MAMFNQAHETMTVGDQETAIVQDRGKAVAGRYGFAKTGSYGTAIAGEGGIAIVGYSGTAIVGGGGTAIVGEDGKGKAGPEGVLIFIREYKKGVPCLLAKPVGQGRGCLKPDVFYYWDIVKCKVLRVPKEVPHPPFKHVGGGYLEPVPYQPAGYFEFTKNPSRKKIRFTSFHKGLGHE